MQHLPATQQFFFINTPLLAEVNTDDNGFFQLNIPA